MSLQAKFSIMTGLLALTVLGGLAVALWSISFLERETARPYKATTSILKELRYVKRNFQSQAELLQGEPEGLSTGEERQVFEVFSQSTAVRFDALREIQWFETGVGSSNARNLDKRISQAERHAATWFDATALTDEALAAREAGAKAFASLFALTEMIEGRTLNEAEAAIAHAGDVRGLVYPVIFSGFVLAVLVGLLRIILDRRWVLTPVELLRTAAARIAAGDFDHRIPVKGKGEIAQLSSEVNHMAEMVETMQEERVEQERLAAVGSMVRRIVHNIRNPMAGIRGMAELTREDLADDSPLAEKQDRIIAAVDRFEHWMTELLDATSPLTITPEACEVVPWLEGVIRSHQPQADNKGVTIVVETSDAPGTASFDSRHVEHALSAVISNAIEATPRDSSVRIELNGVQTPDWWEIRIADEGPGVPPELRESIFRPYFTTKRDGNGIGLAVAHQVIRAHGGEIRLEEDEARHASDSGTTFLLRLPLLGPAEESA